MIAPWLAVPDATAAVAFYTAAFGAVVVEQLHGPPTAIEVAELEIDGARFWVQRDPDSDTSRSPVRMILTVDDPDAAFVRAVEAGATPVLAPYDGHGWRVGRLADPAGHHWELGRRLTG